MKLRNEFKDKTRSAFLWAYWCFICGHSDRGVELDHILGRASRSALNACPLCPKCHRDKPLRGEAGKREELGRTLDYLARTGYRFTKEDKDFYEDNRKLYQKEKLRELSKNKV